MNILEKILVLTLISIASCYAEFDLGTRTPRKDPCTGKVTTSYIYVSPTCRTPQPPPPP